MDGEARQDPLLTVNDLSFDAYHSYLVIAPQTELVSPHGAWRSGTGAAGVVLAALQTT
jgi:hypothetical protein